MRKTKIEWCDSSWNPVTGCFRDCPYCYAGKIAKRFSYEGQTLDAPIELQETWIKDKRGLDPGLYVLQHEVRLKENGRAVPYPFRFCPTFHRYKLDEPIRQKQPRKIFVCSMADLFGEWVPDEWIEEVFAACEKAPWHKYIFLTKNPARYIDLALVRKIDLRKENWWFGTTVTTPNEAFMFAFSDSELNTFISIEPMMEDFGHLGGARPDWIIVGAETGNRKGKITPEKSWIENLSDECKQWSIPLFMKDSLTKIIGEENMRREFPKGLL
jgi:protein gp37